MKLHLTSVREPRSFPRFCGFAAMAATLTLSAWGPQAAAALALNQCSAFGGQILSAANLKLPSGDVTISSASTVSATSTLPEYCKLLGSLAPVDAAAPVINFEINLPASWNGKLLQYGGGGYNGSVVTGLRALVSSPPSVPLPLAQGYVTFGHDAGHKLSSAENGAFALNAEALGNFAYAAYDKVRDAAVAIATAAYGQGPDKVYYFGHSEGGREALAMAQLFPDDYDGIVAVSPVINWTALQIFGNAIGVAQQNGGWLNSGKVATLAAAVIKACDALDNLADGIVSNYLACSSSAFNPSSLRCSGGADTGDNCLSDAQIAQVKAMHTPYRLGFTVANGVSEYPAFGYGGESQTGAWGSMVSGAEAATFPVSAVDEGVMPLNGNQAVRYFVAQDASYDAEDFAPGAWSSQVAAVSQLMDMTNPDLSGFFAHGGKLILFEGSADYAQNPYAGFNYYRALISRFGQSAVNQSVRFYVSPGTVHQGGGASQTTGKSIPASVDLLGTLDAWIGGSVPQSLTQVAQSSSAPYTVSASRPLCSYPMYPRYNGTGSATSASSYTCTGR